MVTNVLLVLGIACVVFFAFYLRWERKKMERLLAGDDTIYIYMAPDSDDAPSLDVYSDEVLAQKEKAQWN